MQDAQTPVTPLPAPAARPQWQVSCTGQAVHTDAQTFSAEFTRERWHLGITAPLKFWWFLAGAIGTAHPLVRDFAFKLLSELK